MSMLRFRAIRFPLLLLGVLAATPAFATAPRTFVASYGNDANACSVTAPCRGFAMAVSQTNTRGEVIVLDSAGYGAVTIGKSVSIIAPRGVYAGISVSSGNGVTINAPGVTVVLRGLTINFPGGIHFNNQGIAFYQGASLLVEDCDISNLVYGIKATAPGGNVAVRNTVLRDNTLYGFSAEGSVLASLDWVRLENNNIGVFAKGGSVVTISNSVLWNSANVGVYARALAGETTRVMVTHSTIVGIADGLRVDADPGGRATVMSDGNAFSNYPSGAALARQGSGGAEEFETTDRNTVFGATGTGVLGIIPRGTF